MHLWETPSEMWMDRMVPAGSDSTKQKHLQHLSGKWEAHSIPTIFLDQSRNLPVTSWDLIIALHLTGKNIILDIEWFLPALPARQN